MCAKSPNLFAQPPKMFANISAVPRRGPGVGGDRGPEFDAIPASPAAGARRAAGGKEPYEFPRSQGPQASLTSSLGQVRGGFQAEFLGHLALRAGPSRHRPSPPPRPAAPAHTSAHPQPDDPRQCVGVFDWLFRLAFPSIGFSSIGFGSLVPGSGSRNPRGPNQALNLTRCCRTSFVVNSCRSLTALGRLA